MRIDVSQILGQGGAQVKAGTGTAPDSLKEGDVIRAEVLSNDRGSVALKTDGGHILKVRLDASVGLLPGDEVQLAVRGKEKGLELISVSRDVAAINDTSGRPGLVSEPANRNLEPYLNKLTELNMPATREAAKLMHELISQNPKLSLEEAAFLASNKLTGDEALMRAALALLANGEKTDAMIARILALLVKPETVSANSPLPAANTQLTEQPQTLIQPVVSTLPDAQPSALNSQLLAPSAANTAPLTDWLTQIAAGSQATAEALGQGTSAAAQATQTIITQNNTILQSTIVENLQEIIQNSAQKGEQPQNLPTTVLNSTANTVPSPPTSQPLEPQSPVNSEFRIPNSGFPTQNLNLHTQLAALLSEIPEFRGTPTPALERFSNMLLRVAGEIAVTPGGEIEKIEELLHKLFTKIGKGDTDSGARLKIAREELFARLALIDEVISRAAQPARATMLEQTHRLMEHVRLLNNIEQFGYIQLPVQFGEERKTAELYVFKRNGGRKPDPENVNILLAIDLENMGRWEALMNIRSKDISIQMEVRGPAEKEHFSENTKLLHEMLAEAGFKLVSTAITYNEAETTPLTALSSISRFTTGRAGAIDLVI